MMKFLKKALVIYVIIFFMVMGAAFAVGSIKNNNLYSLELTCKSNPSALYADAFNFNKTMSFAKRTSDNKSVKDETYNITEMSSSEYKLEGARTRGLFVLKKESEKVWGLYYFQDYDIDPFRYMSCKKSW